MPVVSRKSPTRYAINISKIPINSLRILLLIFSMGLNIDKVCIASQGHIKESNILCRKTPLALSKALLKSSIYVLLAIISILELRISISPCLNKGYIKGFIRKFFVSVLFLKFKL